MAQKNVLGKGLGAIFPDLLNDSEKKKSFSCGIEELRPNRYQPRKFSMMKSKKSLSLPSKTAASSSRLLSARLSAVMKLSPEKGVGGQLKPPA
jgi:hypothetical protein